MYNSSNRSILRADYGRDVTADITHSFANVMEVNNEPCSQAHNVGFDDCIFSAIVANLSKETGCIPPYIPPELKNGLEICTDPKLSFRARNVFFDIYYGNVKSFCEEPCESMQVKSKKNYLHNKR